MVLNDRSPANQDGLSNSSNLTNQEFYIVHVHSSGGRKKKKQRNNSVLAGHTFSLPSSF